jgi:hypothetical protein
VQIQEQALMIYRNILQGTDKDIQQVLDEAGLGFLERLEKNLGAPYE